MLTACWTRNAWAQRLEQSNHTSQYSCTWDFPCTTFFGFPRPSCRTSSNEHEQLLASVLETSFVPLGQYITASFDPSLLRLPAVKVAYVYLNIWEFAFYSIYFRLRIIYHEILWFSRRIPALDDIKFFRDAFIVLVLVEKFGYNLITHICVDTHEKQRDRILKRGIH